MNDTPETKRQFPARRGEGQIPVGLLPDADYRVVAAVGHRPAPETEVTSYEVVMHERTNLDDALEIVAEIDAVRSVVRELKAAFAKSELDGGVKAVVRHPLYIEAQAKLDELHDQLMMVI